MDAGGNCPASADKRANGWSYDDCCDMVPAVSQGCQRTDLSNGFCSNPENLGHESGGVVDAATGAVGSVVDAVGGALDAANPLNDLTLVEPQWLLDYQTCAAICTFSFRSPKNALAIEFRLEIDVTSSDQGHIEISLNNYAFITQNFNKGDDSICKGVPGLSIPGLGGISLCLNLDPGQSGSFIITSSVTVEMHLRVTLLEGVIPPYDVTWGKRTETWECPNVGLITGLGVATLVLLCLVKCIILRRYCRKRRVPEPLSTLESREVEVASPRTDANSLAFGQSKSEGSVMADSI